MADGINPFKIILDAFEPTFYMLLSLENIAENFMVENDGVFFDFVKSRGDVVVGVVPRILNQLRIIIVVYPRCLETERSRPSS